MLRIRKTNYKLAVNKFRSYVNGKMIFGEISTSFSNEGVIIEIFKNYEDVEINKEFQIFQSELFLRQKVAYKFGLTLRFALKGNLKITKIDEGDETIKIYLN